MLGPEGCGAPRVDATTLLKDLGIFDDQRQRLFSSHGGDLPHLQRVGARANPSDTAVSRSATLATREKIFDDALAPPSRERFAVDTKRSPIARRIFRHELTSTHLRAVSSSLLLQRRAARRVIVSRVGEERSGAGLRRPIKTPVELMLRYWKHPCASDHETVN